MKLEINKDHPYYDSGNRSRSIRDYMIEMDRDPRTYTTTTALTDEDLRRAYEGLIGERERHMLDAARYQTMTSTNTTAVNSHTASQEEMINRMIRERQAAMGLIPDEHDDRDYDQYWS